MTAITRIADAGSDMSWTEMWVGIGVLLALRLAVWWGERMADDLDEERTWEP